MCLTLFHIVPLSRSRCYCIRGPITTPTSSSRCISSPRVSLVPQLAPPPVSPDHVLCRTRAHLCFHLLVQGGRRYRSPWVGGTTGCSARCGPQPPPPPWGRPRVVSASRWTSRGSRGWLTRSECSSLSNSLRQSNRHRCVEHQRMERVEWSRTNC